MIAIEATMTTTKGTGQGGPARGGRDSHGSRIAADSSRHGYRRAVLRGLLATMRPRQWIKNILVVAAPLAAGDITQGSVIRQTLIAFGAFCLASSAVYCFNDVWDAVADRRHPRKSARPVASGLVPKPLAMSAALILAAGSVAIAAPNPLRLVIAIYLVLNVAYTTGLKNQPVIELAFVASGFLLRAIAGGPATGIPLSQWFLIVASFGSLFVVAGKRLSELVQLGGKAPSSRPILARYTSTYLRAVVAVSAGVTVAAYALWAFEVGDRHHGGFDWATISIAPFVIALLRYMLDIDAGRADEPEQIVISDRTLQVLALLWLVTFSAAALRG
jgi:decaprenyl-phosphate phosphoribosyltransferase